ncbi:hypothetical protein [Amycolatopsis sp. 195334CR]|uniref:hypothetical protein n=1 Tax=Amycolatopsis sp. 195334CR TaxID=2814588 RepID=UPI001A8CC078|nr:hypothetical protein [Amycolatopsis sp. 195334CR]MBN6036145.1 hypothetical protein [Amycolatopsis sp. 195334CR]
MIKRIRAVTLCVLLALTALTTPAFATGPVSWTVEPPRGRIDPVPGTPASAAPLSIEELPARQLESEVDTVRAEHDVPGLAVDLRGQRPDGRWTEWVEAVPGAPTALPGATRSVQARLVLTGPVGMAVGPVGLTAWRAGVEVADPTLAATYRVFATREGLVGGTTANGHKIVQRDHFVALPSRRGLAGKGQGNYSVKVCTADHARCEWAPVWDVGPWNIKDDYWSVERLSWGELPRGLPQAQAAYEHGHNGGKDQFGRKVANPAGIDLADGTFWDGLKLKNNAWVNVTYQWTGGGPWGTVTSLDSLNVRTGPNSGERQVGLAARHAQIRIDCFAAGESVPGTEGTSDRWYRLAEGMYVSGAYVRLAQPPPPC